MIHGSELYTAKYGIHKSILHININNRYLHFVRIWFISTLQEKIYLGNLIFEYNLKIKF